MRLGELVSKIGAVHVPLNADHLVMVIDAGNGMLYDVVDVQFETHDEADGSTTVWIKVEEH
jgi:hypothetical protein